MTQINPLYRYRVALVRRADAGLTADAELREHIFVHAPNAIAAQLLARAVTGAAIAFDPERLGEVAPPEPMVAQSACGGIVLFA
jgi:hypothetical protein